MALPRARAARTAQRRRPRGTPVPAPVPAPAPAMALTGGERRQLRAEAGRRQAAGALVSVALGRRGGAGALGEIESVLRAHELVRVRTGARKKADARVVGDGVAREIGAEVAQVLGHTVLLYRRRTSEDTADGVPRIVFRVVRAVGEA